MKSVKIVMRPYNICGIFPLISYFVVVCFNYMSILYAYPRCDFSLSEYIV